MRSNLPLLIGLLFLVLAGVAWISNVTPRAETVAPSLPVPRAGADFDGSMRASDLSSTSDSPNVRERVVTGGRIRGVVQDSEGRPLPRMGIELAHGEELRLSSTSDEGTFDVLNLPIGAWRVRAFGPGAFDAQRSVLLEPDRPEAEIELILRREHALTVRWVDAEGPPLRLVLSEHQLPRVEIEQDGLAKQVLLGRSFLPREGGIVILSEGLRARVSLWLGDSELEVREVEPPLPSEIVFHIEPEELGALQAVLVLDVVGVQGKARMWLKSSDQPWRSQTPGWTALPPGKWNVVVCAPGSAFRQELIVLQAGERRELGAWALGPNHELRGSVKDALGRPTSTWIDIQRRAENGTWLSLPPPCTAFSSVDGQFAVRTLAAGTYRAACVAGGPRVVFELPREEPLELLFRP